MKRAYVFTFRLLRDLLRWLGVLAWLERRRDRTVCLWLRSLFAVYDMDDMLRLDMPWWTMRGRIAVESWLRSRGKGVRVFEYGSGASTVWLARRGCIVTSLEHHAGWHADLQRRLSDYPNVTLRLVEPDSPEQFDPAFQSGMGGWRDKSFRAYVEAINDRGGPYDLIVIDGRARRQCLQQALQHLAPDGLVIFDNGHRPRYWSALRDDRFTIEHHIGLTAFVIYPDSTYLLRLAHRG